MKNIAILFPGVGYTTDKPLFYYTKKVLKKYDYEIVEINYSELESEPFIKDLREKMPMASEKAKMDLLSYVAKAAAISHKTLTNYDLNSYNQVMFVSKSIGAVVASLYAQKYQLSPIQIMFTPLEYAFQLYEPQEGIVFAGMKDPLVDIEKIKRFCAGKPFGLYLYEDCNHSLETGNVAKDLSNVVKFMNFIDSYLAGVDKTIYDFEVVNQDQELIPLSKYENQVLLIVNTATGCGFTPQYTQLQDLYDAYHKQGFNILDFPCNQFKKQAPGTDKEIHDFCSSRYAIQFPQYSKIDVNGENESPLYTFLKARRGFQGFDLTTQDGQFLYRFVKEHADDYESSSDIKWNFTKFLINRNGQVVARYETTANFEEIKQDIEKLL